MTRLLSSTFQIPAEGRKPCLPPKANGLESLKEGMQNHVHIVLERLLETHYGLYVTSMDPDILLETEETPDLILKTYIAPMLSRRMGGTGREAFVPKIVQFLDDLMGAARGKTVKIDETPETEKLVLEYYPVDMGQPLARLIDKHESQDRVIRGSMVMLSQMCERLGDGNYKPAHKLH